MPKTKKDVQELIIKKALTDENFKKALKADPKGTIAKETGIVIPDNVNINVVEETPTELYLVVPSTSVAASDAEAMSGCQW